MTPDQGANDADFITPDDGFSASDDAAQNRATADAGHDNEADANDDGSNAGNEDDDLLGLDDDTDDGDGDQTTSEEELEEVEIGGKTFKLPKDVKPHLMMQQDYTRKTQEVAEHRKALEQHAEAIRSQEQKLQQQAEFQRANIQQFAQLHAIDERLGQYQQVDWAQLEQEDPLGANSHWRAYQQLKDQRQGLVGELQQKEHQSQQERQRRSQEAHQAQEAEIEKRLQASLAAVKTAIPSWNVEVAGQVGAFLNEVGYNQDEMKIIATDPKSMVVVHDAMKFRQLKAKQAAAKASKPKEEPAPLASAPRGRTAPVPTGLDDRLSADEWVRRRNAQERSRGR
ncbi:hypothetical protein [Aurantimonas coralicida]|uniref:hypothetical protein n=1 Tax=Aurantimonas coralicida TaxID=182270 RepID=UPI001E53A0B3|nr:hypothetical protein [Aurantimonas coralicida]MCD1644154.1 hypothetical protein [Aurantimonas coralicida]